MSATIEVKPSTMDLAKFHIKQSIWSMPAPLSRVAIRIGCAAGLFGQYYRTYDEIGRPTEVLSGPFQGMPYIPLARGSAWLPKILGTYERELNPLFERLGKEPCDVLIDVGSAEGYFAVGLSRTFGIPKVYCFDIDPLANQLLPRIARLNGVADRVTLRGFCHPSDLQDLLQAASHPLLMSDCEGGEVDLLDPSGAPALSKTRILVEVHDFAGTHTIGDKIRERFAATHEIEAIPVEPRHATDIPEPYRSRLTEAEALDAISEWRGTAAGWLYLRPNDRQPT